MKSIKHTQYKNVLYCCIFLHKATIFIYVKEEETKDKYTCLSQLINRKIKLTSIKDEK